MPERMLDLEPLEALRRHGPQAGLPDLPLLSPQQSAGTEAQLQEYLRQKNKPMLPYDYGTLDEGLPPPAPAPPVPPELTRRGTSMGRNSRTGSPMYETGPGLLDESTEGVPQMASGAYGVLNEPTMRGKAGAASDFMRGAMRTASPLMAGPVAAAPGASAAALGYGTILGTGTERALNAAGVPPEYSAAASDVAGLLGAGYAGKVAHSRPWEMQGRLGDLLSSEEGAMKLPGKAAPALTKAERLRMPVGKGLPLTGENVIGVSARLPKEGQSFDTWIEENPEAGTTLFNTKDAQPAGIFPQGPVPRYQPREKSERVVDAFANPRTIAKLTEWARAGQKKMPDSWYRLSPLSDAYQKVWKNKASDKMKQQLGYLAATSSGAKIPQNLKIGSLYNYMEEQGIPITKGQEPPTGYGHRYWNDQQAASQQIREGGFNPLDYQKRTSFIQNLGGNEQVVTADRHFMRSLGMASEDPRFLKTNLLEERVLPGGKKAKTYRNLQQEFKNGAFTMEEALKNPQYWEDAPKKTEYGLIEQLTSELARSLGMEPAVMQEKLWVGAPTGLGSIPEPLLTTMGRRIAYTAHQMGTTPEKVLKAYVAGKIPLLELGAAAAGLETLGTHGGTQNEDDAPPRGTY